jgi:hypothetical protein
MTSLERKEKEKRKAGPNNLGFTHSFPDATM